LAANEGKTLRPHQPNCSRTLGSSGRGAWSQQKRRWSPDRNALQGRRDGETDLRGRGATLHARVGTIGGKHPGFRESVSLRGKASERRSWPICDAERGPSPTGKTGAMDHARRGGSSPDFRGSRLVTKGCSAAFEGGELARSPKGCESFTSGQSVRGRISAGSRETGDSRSEANPLSVIRKRRGRARRVHPVRAT
jgi:hypothetical protein